MVRTTWRQYVLATVALLGLAVATYQLRRAFIRSFFPDGPGRAAAAAGLLAGRGRPGLAPASRVRVALLDGLARDEAARLPNLDALCARGLDLVVDAGFPTVSLPVQHVLFTGLTQQQSGREFRIPQIVPPAGGIPGGVPGSVAVAESHPEIARSFAFARIEPHLPAESPVAAKPGAPAGHRSNPDLPVGWREAGFEAAAIQEVAKDAPLVFVHVLRIDEAGHRHGAASDAYRAAVNSADRLLGSLVAATRIATATAPSGPLSDTRWFVLSDHGHRPGGGHGGAEPSIRLVRACIVGAGVPAAATLPPGRRLHLIDLTRALAESVGVALPPEARGRALATALAAPAPDATLPRPTAARWLWASALALLALAITAGCARPAFTRWSLPLWLPAAYGSVVLLRGAATLSNPMIYPPLGRSMLVAATPAGLLLAFGLLGAARRASLGRALASALALPVGLALAALTLCGGSARLLGLAADPPLVPGFTAHASLLLALVAGGALVAALSVVALGLAQAAAWIRARGARRAAPSGGAPTPTDPAPPTGRS